MNQAHTAFIPYTSADAVFNGVAPAGWIEKEPGQFGRGAPATDPTFLVQLGVPGATVDLVTSLLLPRLGLDALPPRSGRFENEKLSWDLYALERHDPEAGRIKGDLAFAQGDAGVYVVLLGAAPEEYDGLHYTVFVRVVDAFTPLPAKKREPRTDKTSETNVEARAEVLLVRGEQLENEASELVARLLQAELGLSTAFLDLDALDRVDLDGVKLIYFPGGEASSIRPSEQALRRVRQAVAAGSSYIGTCAGAFIAAEATTTVSHIRLGRESCSFGVFPGLAEWGGGEGTWPFYVDVRHPLVVHSSFAGDIHPAMEMRFTGGTSNLVPSYPEELQHSRVATLDRPADGRASGKRAAMTATVFGKGRVFLSGPHPEAQKATHSLLLAAAEWCTGRSDPTTDTVPAIAADIPAEGIANRFFICSAAGSHDPHRYPIGFIWDFGDGSHKQYRSEAIHIYEKPGTYTVTLIVTTGTRHRVKSAQVRIGNPQGEM